MTQLATSPRFLAPLLFAAALLVCLGALATPAAAQQQSAPGAFEVAQFNFFDRLFREPTRRRPPENVGRPRAYERPDRPARRAAPAPRQREQRNWQPAAAPKDPDAKTVYVFGDAFASGLARSLESAFANTPTVQVESRIKPGSGIVRDDYYDWEKAIRETLDSESVDVAVVMMGSNDRQPFLTGPAVGEDTRSEKWEETYIARVDRLVDLFAEKAVPLYWIGLPIMQREGYARDMAFVNEVFKARSQRAGGRFIDMWSRFADEEGRYAGSGPDVNGQIRRLRNANGIHMTRTGNEKLAFFVEQELRAALTGGGALAAVPDGRAGPGRGNDGPVEIDVSLTSAEPPREGVTLMGGTPGNGAVLPTPTPAERESAEYRVLVQGKSPEPRAGRADSFAWPGKAKKTEDRSPGETSEAEAGADDKPADEASGGAE